MRLPVPVFIALVINLLLASRAVIAENTDAELPTAKQIREIYEDLSDDWPKIPDVVLLVVRYAEDVNYFAYPIHEGVMAILLGKQFSDEKSQSIRPRSTPMSVTIGAALTHDEVLNWYVNAVALGQGCLGVPDAGMAYFGKSVNALSLEEIAYLAAIRKAPDDFHPVTSYDRAIERRNILLSQMSELGGISAEEARTAASSALVVQAPLGTCDQNR